ncbi:topoisomerase DNA-binding C4 zinc finger domain-containing protein [Pseudomonas sp. CDFA 550]|nr:topoisomerase [Pseudomonas quasicaspiana]MCD5972705.1 topoisomerase DNA-binding C4 zinc finger domain-containing protein [Pseudomonas quasicaspiana]
MAVKFSRLNSLLARASAWFQGKREPVVESQVVEETLPDVPPVEPVKPKVRKAKPKAMPKAAAEPKAPACPHCKKVMVMKVARTGANAGGNFWGCGDYPKCRGIRAIFAPMKVK